MRKLFITILFLVFIVACKDKAPENHSGVNANQIYFNYRIWGEEDKEEVTCLFQFHYKGPEGTTLLLEKPSMIKLDGEEIPADSTPMTSAFYEVQKPLETFTGKHTITFIDVNRNEYQKEFSFTPFALQTELPDVVTRQDLVLSLDGLEPSDRLDIVLTDTAFATDDVQVSLTVNNGQLVIPEQQWQQVSSGPVFLSLSKEEEQPVKAHTKGGGRLVVSYSLRREFILTD